MREMTLKTYNKLLTSSRWSNKVPKDNQILALVGVSQKHAYDTKMSSDKANMDTTKRESDYIKDLPCWIPEDPKDVLRI